MKRLLIILSTSLLLLSGCNVTHKEYCEVTFKNYDASVLYYTSVKYGESAIYQGDIPTRPTDSQFDYTFIGWDKPLDNIKADTTFIAQYENNPSERTCNFFDGDGNLLYTTKVKSGESVTYKGEKIPAKQADSTYYYEFNRWDKSLDNITVDTDFYPVFNNLYNLTSLVANRDFKMFQGIEVPDEYNTNFVNVEGAMEAKLKFQVLEDGVLIDSKSVFGDDLVYDYSKVNFDVLGTYELTAMYYGVTWKGKVEVVPNASTMNELQTYFLSSCDPQIFDGGLVTVYKEGYVLFENGYSYDKFNLLECVIDEQNQTLRVTSEKEHTDVIYSIYGSSLNPYDYKEYPTPVKTYEIVSNAFLPMAFEIHVSFDEEESSIGRLFVIYDTTVRVIDAYYEFDSSNQTIDIKLPFFEHKLTLNNDEFTY